MKRFFDFTLAIIIIAPAAIVVAVAAIPALLECRANPFFLQKRVGRHQKIFTLIKLRTMHKSTPSLASHQVSAQNITRSGKFFRKTKIDELPQIFNVLMGQMSFVGPRPCLPSQAELRSARDIRGVYSLRPGITGIAQVKGIDMSTPEELAIADALYLDRVSVVLDFKLVLITALGSGRGDAIGVKNTK